MDVIVWVRCVGGNSFGISGKGMEADGEEGVGYEGGRGGGRWCNDGVMQYNSISNSNTSFP